MRKGSLYFVMIGNTVFNTNTIEAGFIGLLPSYLNFIKIFKYEKPLLWDQELSIGKGSRGGELLPLFR